MTSKSTFRGFFSILLTILGAGFLGYAAFGVEYSDPADQTRVIDLVLGFVMGGMLTTVIDFHLGSSQGEKDKTDLLKPTAPKPENDQL